MANSPSHRWEDGKLVERAIETNRWKVDRFGNPIEETEEKAVQSAENKSVAKPAAKKKD